MPAKVGQPAPDFTAPVFDPERPAEMEHMVSLTDYRDRWLVFFWYPSDFTHVCPTEITALSDRLDEFLDCDCSILGASTDSVYSHRAWTQVPREKNGIAEVRFPLLSDRTHRIAVDYEVLVEEEGFALRGLFIIDPDGVLQYATVHNLNIGRSVDETLRVLQGLQTGGFCPSDWKPGQEILNNYEN
jgi:peroxiredoxin (alkyl hydroperoxide reductase subunit C)